MNPSSWPGFLQRILKDAYCAPESCFKKVGELGVHCLSVASLCPVVVYLLDENAVFVMLILLLTLEVLLNTRPHTLCYRRNSMHHLNSSITVFQRYKYAQITANVLKLL